MEGQNKYIENTANSEWTFDSFTKVQQWLI